MPAICMNRDTAPPERFGAFDRDGTWIGHLQEVGTDEVVLDRLQPKDITRVNRIESGVMSLYQGGRIGDAEVVAADRFAADWSRGGTPNPGRTSEARFLGVSLGGAASSDGIATSTIDVVTRYLEACASVSHDPMTTLMPPRHIPAPTIPR